MSFNKPSGGTSSPFPDHYEQTRIDGKEHPADVVINNLPVIIRFKRRLSKLSEELRQSVRDPKPFVAYVDARGLYQSTRENLFFNAGFEHGLLAERQDCLAERMANDPVARRLLGEINQLTLTTELPRNRVVMLLLEAAWAQIKERNMKKEIIQILKRPFGQEIIKHRQGHDGKQLDYVPVQ
jgi:hypothetical protein